LTVLKREKVGPSFLYNSLAQIVSKTASRIHPGMEADVGNDLSAPSAPINVNCPYYCPYYCCKPMDHSNSPVAHFWCCAHYKFLNQFIKPETLTSADLWQGDVDEQDCVAAIEKFVAVRRESKNLASPIWVLLGAQKISNWYPLMKKKVIKPC
jgi:hypothetical protein